MCGSSKLPLRYGFVIPLQEYQWNLTLIIWLSKRGVQEAYLSHSGVCLGKDHLNHVQGDGKEGPLLVHPLQQLQLALLDQCLQCRILGFRLKQMQESPFLMRQGRSLLQCILGNPVFGAASRSTGVYLFPELESRQRHCSREKEQGSSKEDAVKAISRGLANA